MNDELARCMVLNTRKAARAITRRYDSFARPFGITSTQFSLLGAIAGASELSFTEVAELLGLERTTLLRNVDRLEKLGLVQSRPSAHGNARHCDLTSKGRELIAQMLPPWRKAQAELRDELSASDFDSTIATLQRLASI